MIKEIEIHNFGIFYGTHTIRLASDARDNVSVITSKGGGGKSTVIYALQWCLYDAINLWWHRSEADIVNVKHLNESVGTCEVSVCVRLVLPNNGKEISFKRTMTLIRQDERKRYTYEINGEQVSACSFDTFVQRMMPDDGVLVFENEFFEEPETIINKYARHLDILDVIAESNRVLRELYLGGGEYELIIKEDGIYVTEYNEYTCAYSFCDLSHEEECIVGLSIFVAVANLTHRYRADRGFVVFEDLFMDFSEDKGRQIVSSLMQIIPKQTVFLSHISNEESFITLQEEHDRVIKMIRLEPDDEHISVNVVEQ